MKTFETEKHNIPEGATHYSEEDKRHLFTWFKVGDTVEFYNNSTNKWQLVGAHISCLKSKITPIPKPETTEWNGEGLPPVGVELDGVKVMGCNGVKEWHCKPYWKVVGHHIDGERFFVEHVLGGRLQVFPVDSNQYRAVESPQQELEAAYDLYCDAQHAVDVIVYDSFEQFKADEVQVKFWLAIVDKTNYRKGE